MSYLRSILFINFLPQSKIQAFKGLMDCYLLCYLLFLSCRVLLLSLSLCQITLASEFPRTYMAVPSYPQNHCCGCFSFWQVTSFRQPYSSHSLLLRMHFFQSTISYLRFPLAFLTSIPYTLFTYLCCKLITNLLQLEWNDSSTWTFVCFAFC